MSLHCRQTILQHRNCRDRPWLLTRQSDVLIDYVTMEQSRKYPCPCCGYLVFRMPPGYHEHCPICGWEDELSQLRFVEMTGISNHVTLVKAQKNFIEYGAAERRKIATSRPPVPGEVRDKDWRPVDPARDNIEIPRAGEDYAVSYPQDTTVLYYWRTTFWHRYAS